MMSKENYLELCWQHQISVIHKGCPGSKIDLAHCPWPCPKSIENCWTGDTYLSIHYCLPVITKCTWFSLDNCYSKTSSARHRCQLFCIITCRPSTSSAASSFFTVGNHGWFHPCIDYKALKLLCYPCCLMLIALEYFCAATIFTKLNLHSANYLLWIYEEDECQ